MPADEREKGNSAARIAVEKVDEVTGGSIFDPFQLENRQPAIDPDPIFAAIGEHKSLWEKWSLLEKEINNIEEAESEKSRDRPVELIAWRSYSSIGDYEIDRAREEFLRQPNADHEQIEKEYQDAKARLKAVEREAIAWDYRMGIGPLRKQCEQLWRAWEREGKILARTRPTTPAGAGPLIAYIRSVIIDTRDWGEWAMDDWTMPALKTVAASLAEMNKVHD
jgi:hypothetical protein